MKNHTLHLTVFDGMEDREALLGSASVHNPGFELRSGRFRVVTAARSLAAVTTRDGARIRPDTTIDEISPCGSSLLILPGGRAWEAGGNLEALERAHAFAGNGTPVAAIGAATLALARAGLLDDRLHTSNDADYLASSGYRGAAYFRPVPAITDRNVITASGDAQREFAGEIFRLLDLYSFFPRGAWHALDDHSEAAEFYAMPAQLV
jgi:putative intracellular protease/amidase